MKRAGTPAKISAGPSSSTATFSTFRRETTPETTSAPRNSDTSM
ncbi:MAG: hypothetical protein ACXVH0_06705 [Thermoanaerobaculia bacterium]